MSRSWRPFLLVESEFGMAEQMGDAPLRNPGFTLSLSKEVSQGSHHIVTQGFVPIVISQRGVWLGDSRGVSFSSWGCVGAKLAEPLADSEKDRL